MPRQIGPSWFISHWCSGSCRKACFLFEGYSYCKHFQGHEVVSVPVDSRTAGLIIGKGGANIKAIKQDLQTREETKCNPWIISGPKEDVREFLARLNARFGVCALGGLDTHRFVCPGCSLDFPNGTLMLAHVRNGACPATSCIAHDCTAVYADRDSCRKHESFCKKVQRCPGCSAPFASGSDLQSHVNLKGSWYWKANAVHF